MVIETNKVFTKEKIMKIIIKTCSLYVSSVIIYI